MPLTPEQLQQIAAPMQGGGNVFQNMKSFYQQHLQPTQDQTNQIAAGMPFWGQPQQKLGVNQPNPNPQPGDLPWNTGNDPMVGPRYNNPGPTGPLPPIPRPNQPQMGGTTRRGSQILDAQGNVIGHYDDNNQPVYHGGQGGGQGQTPPSWNLPPGPRGPIWTSGGGSTGGTLPDWMANGGTGYGRGIPQGPVASTNMGMAPSWARLGVPGSMQQSLYGQGLLRPAMPSMNNQSGY